MAPIGPPECAANNRRNPPDTPARAHGWNRAGDTAGQHWNICDANDHTYIDATVSNYQSSASQRTCYQDLLKKKFTFLIIF